MKVYPDSVEEKLGFDVLRHRLAGYMLSAMGQERLDLQRPSADLNWIQQTLSQVSAFQDVFRFDDALPLYAVDDVRPQLKSLMPEGATTDPEVLLQIHRLLEMLRRMRSFFLDRKDQYPTLFEPISAVVPFPELEKRIAAIVDDDGTIKDSASPELRRLRRKRLAAQSRLRSNLMDELSRSVGEGFSVDAQPTMRSGRMVIPVRAEAKRKVKGFVHDVSATGQTVYIEPASCLELNNEIRSVEAEEHHEIRRILIDIASQIRVCLHDIMQGIEIFGQIDVLQAKAQLANKLDAFAKKITDDGCVNIKLGRNPVLQLHLNDQDAAEERAVVPLDLSLGKDAYTLILTGPNAGGKTVAMKTVGLFALMLSYGMPLPADELTTFSIFDQLIVDLGDEQSIENDLSTFSSHVANLKQMTSRADASTLVLIDEAGTGTDPAEGAALAQVVFETLTEARAKTIATTHHGSLKVFAHDTAFVENGSMQFDQATLSPTYKLMMGIPGSSYAFEIASRMGLDPAILEKARTLIGNQATRMEDLLTSLEARNLTLEARLTEAEAALAQASEEKARYKELFDTLEAQREDIKGKALEEAEEVIRKANAQIERTIREIKENQAAKEATKEARSELETFKKDLGEQKRSSERKQQHRKKRKKGQQKRERRSLEPLQVGDQVVLDGGRSTAELLEIAGKDAVIMAGSMHMRVKVSRLTKVAGPRKQKVTVKQIKAANDSGLNVLQARQRIDLRGQRVEGALAEVVRLIDDALTTNLSRVEIVHGKGTGALRHAIHDYLNSSPDVEKFEDAPWEEGGPGVTYAFLK